MEKKYMSKINWKRVLNKEYIQCDIIEANKKIGVSSLIHIKDIVEPLIQKYPNTTPIKIADRNFYWLQIGLKNTNYWITAVYNEKKEFIQYYIDITAENIISDHIEPYFYDLFLDVVLTNQDTLILLDQDELEDAMRLGEITRKQYNLACTVSEAIMKNIILEKERLDKFCFSYFERLNRDLNRTDD
ncbi:MAG: DUF402 domain-containing protein [Clostridia bacterium]|nr:DUF402 domain-containing protein [Clostridia bacterium]